MGIPLRRLVINLDRNPDRLDHVQEQFLKLKISFERVEAIDGQCLEVEFIDKINTDPSWPTPTKAEFGCFMSHRKCWQNLVDSNENFAAIFEDDLFFSKDAAKFLDNTDWIPDGVEIVKIETVNTKTYFDRWFAKSLLGRKIWKTVSFQSGTGAYIISRGLASRLLSETENYMPAPIDHYLFDPAYKPDSGSYTYQLVPAVCAQECIIDPLNAKLGSSIDARSVKAMIQAKRGSLSQREKIIRELSKGFFKLKKFPFRKRRVVEFL